MQRLIRSSAVALGLLAGGGAAHATGGLFGLSAGANLWAHSSSGDIFSQDVDDDLGLESDQGTHLWAEWDHFIPLVPSVRFDQTELSQEGDDSSLIDLSHTDFTVFWSPLPLPFISVDLGITGRNFDGEVDYGDIGSLPSDWTNTTFSGWVPLGFARASISLPATPLQFQASVRGIEYDDHSITDAKANVAYNFSLLGFPYFGAMAGYRQFAVNFEDFEDITTDVSFSGGYAGIYARF